MDNEVVPRIGDIVIYKHIPGSVYLVVPNRESGNSLALYSVKVLALSSPQWERGVGSIIPIIYFPKTPPIKIVLSKIENALYDL